MVMIDSIAKIFHSYALHRLSRIKIRRLCFALLFYGHILITWPSATALSNDSLNKTTSSKSSITNSKLEPETLIVPGIATQLFDDKTLPIEGESFHTLKSSEKLKNKHKSAYKSKHPAQVADIDKTLVPSDFYLSSNSNAKSFKMMNPNNKTDQGSVALRNHISHTQNKVMDIVKPIDDPLAQGDSLDWNEINNSIDAPSISKSHALYGSPFGDIDDTETNYGHHKYHGHHSSYPHIVFTGRRVLQEEGSGQECVLASNSGCGPEEQCIRRHQFDICECKKTHGRRHGHRERRCKPIKFQCGAIFQLIYGFRADFEDQSSREFLDFAQPFLDVVETDIQSNQILDRGVVSTKITKCQPGSTIVYLSIGIGQDSTESPETIVSLLKRALVQAPPNNIGYWSNSLQSIRALSLCDEPETNPCSKNAECLTVNEFDFVGCRCKSGYEDVSSSFLYPGAICSKSVGACEVGTNSGCGALEVCVNIDGSNACICQPPFIKDVFTGDCKVATSCDATNNFGCGLNEVCQPQNFGSTCTCTPGYTRNLLNGQCEAKPGDECDVQTQIGCKIYAREKCVEVSGRGVCLCIYGYSRNPNTLTCERVSPQCNAVTNTGCPPSEKCEWQGEITVCNCLPGYVRNALTQRCQSDTSTIRVRIHLLLVYVPGLENVYSPSFQQLQNILLEAFWYVVSRDPELNQAILDIVILRFLPGSIIADTRFIIQSSANVSGNYIKDTIQNSIIPPEPVFQSLRFKDATVEDVEEESPCSDPTLNYCSVNATCYPKGSVYSCKCLPGYRDVSTPGLTGEKCEMECSDLFCTSKGKCYFEGDIRKCRCSIGHYGKLCQINGIAILITLVVTILLLITLTISMICKSKTRRIREKNAKADGDNFARREVSKDGKKKMKGITDKSKVTTKTSGTDERSMSSRYRKLSIGSERPNLVEIISSQGENIESTASTSVSASGNYMSTMAPNQSAPGPSARDLNNGSPLRIITRNSFRQINKNEEYTPWWHSENTETDGSLNEETTEDGVNKLESPNQQHLHRPMAIIHHTIAPPPPMPPRLP